MGELVHPARLPVAALAVATARLLPRLLKGRKSGPVFITERKARMQLPVADLDERGSGRAAVFQ